PAEETIEKMDKNLKLTEHNLAENTMMKIIQHTNTEARMYRNIDDPVFPPELQHASIETSHPVSFVSSVQQWAPEGPRGCFVVSCRQDRSFAEEALIGRYETEQQLASYHRRREVFL